MLLTSAYTLLTHVPLLYPCFNRKLLTSLKKRLWSYLMLLISVDHKFWQPGIQPSVSTPATGTQPTRYQIPFLSSPLCGGPTGGRASVAPLGYARPGPMAKAWLQGTLTRTTGLAPRWGLGNPLSGRVTWSLVWVIFIGVFWIALRLAPAPHQREPVEVVQAFDQDASWVPLMWGIFQVCPTRRGPPGKIQDTLERFYLSA